MSAAPQPRLSFDDWLAIERTATDQRSEYVAGEVFAVAGGTEEHNLILLNVGAELRNQLKDWEAQGYGALPVCMAKTQYSFTTDPDRRGAPTGFSVPVREVRLSAGAGFVVVICGEIMTMPGLPRVPSAESIRLNADGDVEGLF